MNINDMRELHQTQIIQLPLEEYEVLILKERMLHQVEAAFINGTLEQLGPILFPEGSFYRVGPQDFD